MHSIAPRASIAALALALVIVGTARGQQARDSLVATGESVSVLRPLDEAVAEILRATGASGAALAVAHEGRLVFARGYGFADLATREPVTPASRFRIASVSKPITAVATMKLVQEGRLSLDDRATELLDFEPEGSPLDPRIRDITVRDLLYHAGGWDRERSGFDPPFAADRIAIAMSERPPASPGMTGYHGATRVRRPNAVCAADERKRGQSRKRRADPAADARGDSCGRAVAMTTDTRRLGRIGLAVLLASIVLPARLSAQDAGPQPEPGDRIRFLVPLVHPSFVESDLVRLDTDTLRATGLSEPARRYAVARTQIERIELRMAESRTFLGAGIGAGVGLVSGTAFMAAFCDSPDSACDTGDYLRGVLIIALPPALVGAVIGSAVNSERWMPLEP